MRGFGAMLAFEVKTEIVDADAVQRKLRLIRPAASLGGVETTICALRKRLMRSCRVRIGSGWESRTRCCDCPSASSTPTI